MKNLIYLYAEEQVNRSLHQPHLCHFDQALEITQFEQKSIPVINPVMVTLQIMFVETFLVTGYGLGLTGFFLSENYDA